MAVAVLLPKGWILVVVVDGYLSLLWTHVHHVKCSLISNDGMASSDFVVS